jgi:hypothetical protein
MTRHERLVAVAVEAGLSVEQAERVADNMKDRVPADIEDAADQALRSVDPPRPACGYCRIAERLAAAWLAHDADVVEVLRRLAAAVERETDYHSPEVDAALDAAWSVLGAEVRSAERQAAGCAECGAPLASAKDDLCAACAERVPELPGGEQ